MKRPFKIHEEFVLQNEKDFDAFMLEQDFEFFEVKLESDRELCIQGKDILKLRSIYRTNQPVSIYLIKTKVGSNSLLILKNKLRFDTFVITLFMSIVFFVSGYGAIVDTLTTGTGLGLLISTGSILAINGFCYINEKSLAKHLKMVLANNEFIDINA